MKPQKYKIIYTEGSKRKYLECPNCKNKLSPFDIEEFMTCPYCAFAIEATPEVEEFILSPVVNEWAKRVCPAYLDNASRTS